MARVFAGELTRIDVEVVERLRRELPDDFSVLAEVNVGRNVDVIVVRPMGREPALLVAAELKHVSRPLMGQTDGLWRERMNDGEWRPIRPSNNHDINHHWQAVNAADALQRWLRHNQDRFLGFHGAVPDWQVRVWPQLVLYGVPREAHELPAQPVTRFGSWFFNIDQWINELNVRRPREGMTLSQLDVERLIDALGLMNIPNVAALATRRADTADYSTDTVVQDLARRVLALEIMLAATAGATTRHNEPRPAPVLRSA